MSHYDSEQLDRLEPTYLHSYGLADAPFSPAHDDRFVYLDAERTQRLNLLQHLSQYSDLLSIVGGERGSGKTTLLRQFVKRADQDWRICQIDATPMMSADQLVRHMAVGFGLQPLPAEASEQQQAFYDHLIALRARNIVPILIIDDAHDLPEDALRDAPRTHAAGDRGHR